MSVQGRPQPQRQRHPPQQQQLEPQPLPRKRRRKRRRRKKRKMTTCPYVSIVGRFLHLLPSFLFVSTMPRKPHAPRNHELVRGVSRYSRSAMFRRSGRAAVLKAGHKFKPVEPKKVEKKPVVKAFNKKETRTIEPKGPRFYPTERAPRPLPSSKHNHKPTRLRKSITPGTVLIILSGRFRGKRVIFLKQLQPSGLLLVTGPFKINGVPVRRINQAYTIATSTKVDITGLQIPEKFNDAYFKKEKAPKQKKTEEQFFATENKPKKTIAAHRIADQKEFDANVLEIVNKVPHLAAYLNAKFTLTKGQYPHVLKF